MYPASFDYRRASSVEDAISALSADPDRDVRVLAGGHGLLPAMKTEGLAPDALVDVSECDTLRGVEVVGGDAERDHLAIGPLTTHAELADADPVADHAPVLAEAARAVGDVQIRTRGTIGGNLVEADPEADLPAAMAATGATIRVRGPDGERDLPATDFFAGAGETVVGDDELLTEIRVPTSDAGAYVRRTHPARGFAMVGVAVALDVADDTLSDVGVGAVGATDRPVRLSSVEDELAGRELNDVLASTSDDAEGAASPIETVAARATDDIDGENRHGDVHASGEFRASILGAHVERALETACAGLPGGETDA